MTAATFDPFAVDRPKLRLGDHGEWELGDITEARRLKLASIKDELVQVEGAEDATVGQLALTVGKLCEAACINADGLAEKIADLADGKKHGENALGAGALKGVALFVKEHLEEIAHAGEG